MKPALRWLQNNPILITAVILCIAALVMLMVVHFQGRVFLKQLGAHGATIRDIKNLEDSEMKVPSERIGGPEVVFPVVITEPNNNELGVQYA